MRRRGVGNNEFTKIYDTTCAITQEDFAGRPVENAVVFNERVYDKNALKAWYLKQYNDYPSKKRYSDIVSGRLLPPVRSSSSWPYLFAQHVIANPNIPIVVTLGILHTSRVLLGAQVDSEEGYTDETRWVKYVSRVVLLGSVSLASLLIYKLMADRVGFGQSRGRDISEWLDEQCVPYDPNIHKTAEEIEELTITNTSSMGVSS